MVDREERKVQAEKHSGLMRSAFAKETAACVEAAVIYEEGEGRSLELPDASFPTTETYVVTSFAPEAIYRDGKGKTAVVDPVSFTRPGGAYLDGSFGPEQILCADSNLFEVLSDIAAEYHQKNRDYRRGMLFTDRALYLPEVTFLRGGEVRPVDVIAVAEPLRARALENHRSERECDNALRDRIETLLRIAAANEVETLVVGAFGCGRQGYDPEAVIALFKAWIEAHPGAIGRIVFAVPRAYVDSFRETFGAPPAKEEPKPEVTTDSEDEEEFDWRSVPLPEGVTIR